MAPDPAGSPILADGFGGNTIGYTVYAWYDSKLYLEGGAYSTLSPWVLARFGNDFRGRQHDQSGALSTGGV